MSSFRSGVLAGLLLCVSIASAEAVDLPKAIADKLEPHLAEQMKADAELAKGPTSTRDFGYSYRFEAVDSGGSFAVDTTLIYQRLPETAFVLERKIAAHDNGYRSEIQTYFAAGGLLPVLETRELTKSEDSKIVLEGRLISYGVSGNLFPIAVGNKFNVEWELKGSMNLKMVSDCTVEGTLSAAEFHAQLTKSAFRVVCNNRVNAQVSGARTYYYIQELNHFIPSFRDSECEECKGFRLTVQ